MVQTRKRRGTFENKRVLRGYKEGSQSRCCCEQEFCRNMQNMQNVANKQFHFDIWTDLGDSLLNVSTICFQLIIDNLDKPW